MTTNKANHTEIIAFDGEEPSATALIWVYEDKNIIEDVRVKVSFSPEKGNMISEARLRKYADIAAQAVLKALEEEAKG